MNNLCNILKFKLIEKLNMSKKKDVLHEKGIYRILKILKNFKNEIKIKSKDDVI
jgi:hypothetical protein